MPVINPLSNEQIFLKKIAENTGSDYNTGDVSEINPITIDQILLKEIAANTAGQSGDITELEEKVSANAEAIEAIVNENGCCNIAPTFTSATVNGRTFTVSSDGTVTVTGAGDGTSVYYSVNLPKLNENCQYILNGCPLGGDANKYALSYSNSVDGSLDDFGSGIEFTPYDYSLYPDQNLVIYINGSYSIQTPLVFKPMLYDARLNPTGYVPYAMTNRELTDEVNNIETLQTIYPSMLLTGSITIKRNCGVKFVVADNLILTADLASGDFIELCTAGTVLNPPVVTTEFLLHAASGGANIAPVNLIMSADGSIYVKNYSSSATMLYAHCCGAYI